MSRGEDEVCGREKLEHNDDSGKSIPPEPFLIHVPSAEANEEIGGVGLENEGSGGALGKSGTRHREDTKESEDGNEKEWNEETSITEVLSSCDQECAHKHNNNV